MRVNIKANQKPFSTTFALPFMHFLF